MDILDVTFLLYHGAVLVPQGTLRGTIVHAKGAGMVLEGLKIPDFLTKKVTIPLWRTRFRVP